MKIKFENTETFRLWLVENLKPAWAEESSVNEWLRIVEAEVCMGNDFVELKHYQSKNNVDTILHFDVKKECVTDKNGNKHWTTTVVF